MTTWADVWPEHEANVGFIEGPARNQNPWTEELGVGDVAYCAAGATVVPHHHGVDWGPDAQFPHRGIAYSPYIITWAKAHGLWVDDHASQGQPCDLQPGDVITHSWNNNGIADHTETVKQVYADGTYDVYGYNAGHPEGCHIIRRDRKYLMGRLRMTGAVYNPPPPAPTPAPPAPSKEDDAMKPVADTPSWCKRSGDGAFPRFIALWEHGNDGDATSGGVLVASVDGAPFFPAWQQGAKTIITEDILWKNLWWRRIVGAGQPYNFAEADGAFFLITANGTYDIARR